MNKVQCPICDNNMPGHWSDYPDFPFCSKRCRTIDLGRWLGEGYRFESKRIDEELPTDDDTDEA